MYRWATTSLALAGCQLVFPLDPTGEPEPAKCSTTRSVPASFEDPLWVLRTAQTGAIGAAGEMVHLGLTTLDTEDIVETQSFFDLRGSSISVEVEVTGDFHDDNFVSLDSQQPDFGWNIAPQFVRGNALVMRLQNGMLTAGHYADGVFLAARNVTYDPMAHRFWRISQDGDTTTWSVSSDGKTFTDLQSLPMTGIGMVKPRVYALQGTVGGPFTAAFQSLNGGGDPDDPVCGANKLRDAFDGSMIDRTVWGDVQNIGCTLAVQAGQLVVTDPDVGEPDNCMLTSATIYNLREHAIVVDLQAAATPNRVVFAALGNLAGAAGAFILQDGRLSAKGTASPNPYMDVAYDPAPHRYLRLSATTDDQLVWETSADGVSFDFFTQTGDYAGLDRVRYQIGVSGDASPSGDIRFDNVNIAP